MFTIINCRKRLGVILNTIQQRKFDLRQKWRPYFRHIEFETIVVNDYILRKYYKEADDLIGEIKRASVDNSLLHILREKKEALPSQEINPLL